MRSGRSLVAAILAVIALGGSALAAGASTQGSDTPPADDVGITAKEIRLAVLADVDTPVQPGLFQAAVDTMRAWAKYVNRQGGIAGRKVVIDFTDTKLNPNEARDGVIKACSDDFAMVGGEALFLNNVDDMVACVDKQGNATGIPNMPGLALDVAERCAPTTYITNGDTAYCATKDEHPQTYTSQIGDALYYLKKYGDLHGVFAVPADLKSTKNAMSAYFEAMVDAGIKRDAAGFYDTSAMAPQSSLTPIVQAAKNSNSTIVYNGNALGTMVLLRREAKLQGLDSVKVWACNQGCYDTEFLKQGGSDIEGTYSVLTSLPFYTEYKRNPLLKAVVKDLGGIDKMNANSMSSLVAAVLFKEAAEKAVSDSGTLTRKSLLDALGAMTAFDAGGLIGPTDISTHQPPVCIVIVQVKNGKWVRVSPKKPGTFDCNKKNLAVHQLDQT